MDFNDGEMGDIPTRRMRVKILYTFDQDYKTNCLARIPDVLNIPAVAIDESNQVGVIELKQCLQAIVAASPELLSRLDDGDFTIYAYDYSEYDTPLVGQGMLSAALAVATPNLQSDNKTMITGRVCQNKLALFSNGVKETLEVKLRLVPVARPAMQKEFSTSMDSLRPMSPAVSSGFDPNAWNASMQHHSKFQQSANDYFDFDALAAPNTGDRDMALVDDIFGLGSASSGSGHSSGHQMVVGIAETPTDTAFSGFNPAFAAHSHSAPGSRAGSPMIGPESSTRNDALRHQSFSGNIENFGANASQSRPASRASGTSEVNRPRHASVSTTLQHDAQQQLQQNTEIFYNEDGQPRKRAKVMQTDWRGRSSFGSKSSDLRVTAATAASMHMHRPIPRKPAAPGSNLEPPPRVPTPVPRIDMMMQQQHPTARRSLLRQASMADSDALSDMDNFSDALISSPEDESPGNSITAEGTPQEIPSSPPVFAGINMPQPSSPGLPTHPPGSRIADSGYMSDRAFLSSNNVMSNIDDNEDRNVQEANIAGHDGRRDQQSHPFIKTEGEASVVMPPPYPNDPPRSLPEMNMTMETPGNMDQLPQTMLLNLPPGRRREGSQGPPKAPKNTRKPSALSQSGFSPPNEASIPALSRTTTSVAATPSEAPGSRRGSLALPPMPSATSSDLPQGSDFGIQRPLPKKRQSMQRSRTSSNDSEAGSPAPSDTEGYSRPKGTNRSGAGAQRRKLIEQRMQDSISKGEMPQYCAHCGAIETPTWRKLYVKEFAGAPSPLDAAEGEGETIGVEVVERDAESGLSTKFLIRKAMKKTKDSQPGAGFEELTVCNPCGLWFNKFRVMRPPEKWARKAGTRKRRQRGPDEPGMSTDGLEPMSEAFFTDQVLPDEGTDEGEMVADGRFNGVVDQTGVGVDAMPPPTGRPRANSMSAQQLPARASGQQEWNASGLDAALARAVQSSPVVHRFQGSQEAPIEINDITPKPTRRLLFPSPRREGEVKSLDDNGQVSLKSMLPLDDEFADKGGLPTKPGLELPFEQTNIFEAFTFDKENMAPLVGIDANDDDLAHLFEPSPNMVLRTPRKTPLKNTPRSLQHLMKTPTPGSRSSKRNKPLTPNPNAANAQVHGSATRNGNVNVNDFMTSPSSSSNRYFLRSTPSRLERGTPRSGHQANSPTRRSSQRSSANRPGNPISPSPFSRHLAQMLSDVNDGNGDGGVFSSTPSRGNDHFGFGDLPSFTTPGRMMELTEGEWEGLDGLLSSEFAEYEDGGGFENGA